MKRSSRNSLEV